MAWEHKANSLGEEVACHFIFYYYKWQLQQDKSAQAGQQLKRTQFDFFRGLFCDEATCIPAALALAVPTPAAVVRKASRSHSDTYRTAQ